LLLLVVGALTALGIVRVKASTEVLELGAEITELTVEQARLLDQKRRLEAERAYLRHPDHIQEVARDRLRMIPVAPVLVQTIRVVEDVPENEEDSIPCTCCRALRGSASRWRATFARCGAARGSWSPCLRSR